MRYLLAMLCAVGLLTAPTATACKCAQRTTAERYGSAAAVVLLSISETFEGRVPWPYGLDGGSIPGKLLTLRVLKVWKGTLKPGDTIYGWTPAPGGACDYSHPEVGAHIILFSRELSPHEILSCTTADPDHLGAVSNELDLIASPRSK
jgi:hypothetical protein